MKHDADYYESRYNPRLADPKHAAHVERWISKSVAARAQMTGHLDIPYGDRARQETLDLFRAEGQSRALLMFIHGGYWRARDKSEQSFVALPYVKAGITVAMINYALCPAVKVEDIVLQVLQAGAWLYRNGNNFGAPVGSLYVAGHSAGGHLTAMTLAAQWPKFAADLPPNIVKGALSVSGIYDVEPIMHSPSINADVRFDAKQVKKVSPLFMPPAGDAPFYTAVGGQEQEGFHEQNRWIREKWAKVVRDDIPCPDDNHFTILDRFGDSSSALCKGALKMMRVGR
jgi:arylformamidase